jgi:hypothetical protein
MGADLKVANPEADAVPSRPGSETKVEVKALEAENNSHTNGHSNGKVKSSPNGIVLTPLENSSDKPPKKKRKR